MPKITDLTPILTETTNTYFIGEQAGNLVKFPLTIVKGTNGLNGSDGANGTNGLGVPAGGTAGQVLTKIDSTDNNTKWSNAAGGGGAIIDFTSLSPTLLDAGDTAYINYSAATSVPLNIITEEGLYEMTIIGQQDITIGASDYVFLNPNDQLITHASNGSGAAGDIDIAEVFSTITINASSSAAQSASTNGTTITSFRITYKLAVFSVSKISTFTKAKDITTDSMCRESSTSFLKMLQSSNWTNTTTAWTSLGTLVFPFAQTGKTIVKRII